MGMGTYAQMADVVHVEFVKEVCPQEYAALNEALERLDIIWDQLADSEWSGLELETDEEEDTIGPLLTKLKESFRERTGFCLYLVYHNAKDRGDEIDGCTWAVDGVYQLTTAGKKYKDKIQRCSWTIFG